jgi:hypothetical protein
LYLFCCGGSTHFHIGVQNEKVAFMSTTAHTSNSATQAKAFVAQTEDWLFKFVGAMPDTLGEGSLPVLPLNT